MQFTAITVAILARSLVPIVVSRQQGILTGRKRRVEKIRFSSIAASSAHKFSTCAWGEYLRSAERGQTVADDVMMYSKQRSEQEIADNRYYLKSILEVLQLCIKQGMALRGHDESETSENPGNFRAILQLLLEHDGRKEKQAEKLPGNCLYRSVQIQNDLISVMGKMIREKICCDVRKSRYFALMVDETRDVSKKEQVAVVVRYERSSTVYEWFLTWVRAEDVTAAGLTELICTT